MNIQPIPKQLLIHTIEYEEFKKDGSFGEEFLPKETITFVLVQPQSELKRDATNEEVQALGIIYLDTMNTPNAKPFKEKSKVFFNGKEYRVIACEALYAFDPVIPHHYEVSLK